MIRTTVQVQWDAAAVAVVDEVLALRLMPDAVREEVARRLGVDSVSDKALRNGWERVMRRSDPAAKFSYRGAATSSKPAPHTVRGLGKVEAEPVTQRSERVPSVTGGERVAAPMAAVGAVDGTETACRAFVAPKEGVRPNTGPRGLVGVERILLIPDCHFPFIDRRAWDCMMAAARGFMPDTIAQLGDLIDCYSVSSHDKSPARKERMVDEVEVTNAALDELDTLGATRRLIVQGNHSVRFEKLLASKAPGLHGLVSIRSLLRFDDRGWEFYPYRRTARIGSLALVHDVGEAGKFAAMRARDAYEGDVVIGHVHQMSVTYSGSAKADMHVGACLGWLGAPVAAEDYMAEQKIRRHWQTGFGVAYRCLETDRVVITPVPIFDGRCIVEGKVYVASGPQYQRAAA